MSDPITLHGRPVIFNDPEDQSHGLFRMIADSPPVKNAAGDFVFADVRMEKVLPLRDDTPRTVDRKMT